MEFIWICGKKVVSLGWLWVGDYDIRIAQRALYENNSKKVVNN